MAFMVNRRAFKQIIIALVFFLILCGVGFLIYYYVQPEPSCFDNIQNQEEKEVDCGGPCIPCELMHIKDIEVLWTEKILAQENLYDLVAQIKNPNQNYGSGDLSYKFEFYDSSNNLLGECSGSSFILPNQTKYLIHSKVNSSGQIAQIKFSLSKVEWEKLEDYQPPKLVIQQKEYRLLEDDQPGISQARAVLVNKTNFDFEEIDIDILLFGSYRQLLGLNTTEIRTLLAGQERDFIATWFKEIGEQVSFVEIEAETNIFDLDNYLPATGRQEKFQEY